MVVAQFLSDAGESLVFIPCEEMIAVFLGIGVHAAELVDIERFPMVSDACLLVDDGPAVFSLDGYIAIEKQWREHYQADGSQHAVNEPFHVVGYLFHAGESVCLSNCS